MFLYDAVYLYMTMMEKIVTEKLDWRNGTFWLNMARNWVTNGQCLCQTVLSFHVASLSCSHCNIVMKSLRSGFSTAN